MAPEKYPSIKALFSVSAKRCFLIEDLQSDRQEQKSYSFNFQRECRVQYRDES